MGRAAALWFERGERARASDLRAESRALTKRVLDALKKLGRRPKREVLRREIEQALPESPLTTADGEPTTTADPKA